MKRVLIVVESEKFGQLIKNDLQNDYSVTLCHDAEQASCLIAEQPDALILQLQLPGTDGLIFLENLSTHPPVILVLSVSFSPYITQKLYDLGVGYFAKIPCTLPSVTDRLRDMIRDRVYCTSDPQSAAAERLTRLGISPDYGGGKYLRVGIPLYAQDPEQKLSMELYPAIAECCNTTSDSVEHAIRKTIQSAWAAGRTEAWIEIFPDTIRCPSNKNFISTLARHL